MAEVMFLRDCGQYKVYAKAGRFFVGSKDPVLLRRVRVSEDEARQVARLAKSDVAARIERLLCAAKLGGDDRYREVRHG